MPIVIEQFADGGGSGRLVPPGAYLIVAQAGAPAGYLVCDGSSIPVAIYPNLFAAIGYMFGGAGPNFNLPDMRGCVIAGAGLGTALPGLTNHALGSFFGSETHTLTIAELASHSHLQDAHTHLQDQHTHLQDAHTHTQDAHTHLQDAHTHTQNAHTHTQNAHSHPVSASLNPGSATRFSGVANDRAYNTSGAASFFFAEQITATNQNTTATNQNATATNQNTTAVNQSETAVNQSETAVNQNTTATNQNTTAVNQSEGSSTPFNIIQPTGYGTVCIAY